MSAAMRASRAGVPALITLIVIAPIHGCYARLARRGVQESSTVTRLIAPWIALPRGPRDFSLPLTWLKRSLPLMVNIDCAVLRACVCAHRITGCTAYSGRLSHAP